MRSSFRAPAPPFLDHRRLTALRLSVLFLLLAGLAGCHGSDGPPVGVVYITSGRGDQVIRLAAEDGRVLDSLALDPRPSDGDEPHALTPDPNGRFWYATVAHGDPTLWKFARPGDRLVGRLHLGMAGAARIGISPDGERAYIPDYYRDGDGEPSEVAMVRLHDLEVIGRIRLCPGPHDAEVSPDGGVVAVTCPLSDEIVLLDAASLTVRRRIVAGGTVSGEVSKPMNVVWSPDASRIYAALHHAGVVAAWDTTGHEVARIGVGAGPMQLGMTPDGTALVVANRDDGSVSIVDLTRGVERARVRLGADHPHGVAVSADGHWAFVTYEGTVTTRGGVIAVRVGDGSVAWRTPAGIFTLGVMVLAEGK